MSILDMIVPEANIATSPCEERGLSRDQTRLMTSFVSSNKFVHTLFYDIVNFLKSGDLLVINTSATIPASLEAENEKGLKFTIRLSQNIQFDLWIAELNYKNGPFPQLASGQTFTLPGSAECLLLTRYNYESYSDSSQLWLVALKTETPILEYLSQHALPIRFTYHSKQWPLKHFQMAYANEPGSAEMPSAGRGFTADLINKLISKGVQIVPIILHAGTNSEGHLPPHEEYYKVSLEAAQTINNTRKNNRNVIAVGSTVVRTLETVTDIRGETHPGEGWTKKLITPQHEIKSVNGLLTGFHNPKSSHINLVKSFCNEEHLFQAYTLALQEGYLWEEFGDFHLILP